MARPRKPSHLKAVSGTERADRKNVNEPKPNLPLGDPPKHLTAKQKKVWREIVSIIPHGVLGDCDRMILEIASILMSKLREDRILQPSLLSQLLRCLSSMGMTPSDRSKVTVPGGKKKNPWRDF